MTLDAAPVRKPAKLTHAFWAGLMAVLALRDHGAPRSALRFTTPGSNARRLRRGGKNKRGKITGCFGSSGGSAKRLGGYRFPVTNGWASR